MAQSASSDAAATAIATIGDPIVQIWYVRLLLFALSATLALTVEVGYAKLVPKFPQLYAVLLRAAVWDCVTVGIFAAQVIDLSGFPLSAAADGGHYLPVVVLVYHFMKIAVCAGYDSATRGGFGRARTLHRSLVSRRVLVEFAGGATGTRLFLGRACFVLSGASMWLALSALSWISGTTYFASFVMVQFVAYCAAGLAALEPRQTLPGQLVQWLCTGWGSSGGFFQGPVKILGALFMLPFGVSVIAAQIWLRTLAFIVWLAASYPCCRLQRTDNVYDAFEREMAIPLLQCSYLAYACALAAGILGAGQLSSSQGSIVCVAAVYYVGMLMLWTSPAVLRATVAAEEALDSAAALGEDGQTQLLGPDRSGGGDEVELEDLRSTCEELRALLHRERHNHTVEMAQKDGKLKDQELRAKTAERQLREFQAESEKAQKSIVDLQAELNGMESQCHVLRQRLDCAAEVPSGSTVDASPQIADTMQQRLSTPPESFVQPADAMPADTSESDDTASQQPLQAHDQQCLDEAPREVCAETCSERNGDDALASAPDAPNGLDTCQNDPEDASVRSWSSTPVYDQDPNCEDCKSARSSESEESDHSDEEHSISMADDEPSRLLLPTRGSGEHQVDK